MGGSGAKLGRYQIVKHLASGGMAEVLLARASGIEGFTRHVVIKKIRPALTKDPSFVQMFLNEARLAAQLHHANIVQVHDIGQEGNEYFFAMEYVHGEDVRRLLTQLARRKEKIPFEHAVTIIAAAAVALHHAHEQLGPDRKPLGIVHRDVTPANILVGYDGNVKVVDFGIAKAVAQSTEDTQAGTLKGKASYMSPEQCTGGSVDRRSDVFALGIVLYELITTRRLFKADNDFLTMSAIVGGKVPPARGHRPDLPRELEAIITKALAVKLKDRFQTADEMRAALELFADKARLRMSTSALAAYLKQQFGERPEPWLIDDDEVEMEMTVDFDGSASGVAPPPRESVNDFAIPMEAPGGSPIMKARTKAISKQPANQSTGSAKPKPRTGPVALPGVTPAKSGPAKDDSSRVPRRSQVSESAATWVAGEIRPAVKVIEPEPKLVAKPEMAPAKRAEPAPKTVEVANEDDGRDSAPSLPPPPIASTPLKLAANGTAVSSAVMPDAWPGGSSSVKISRLRKALASRRRIALVAGGAAVAIAVVVVVAMRGGNDKHAPVPASRIVTPAPAPIEQPPPPVTPEAAATPADDPRLKTPAKRVTSKPKPKKIQPAVQKKKWDPNSLFPSKK